MFDGSFVRFEKLKRPDSVRIFPILPNGDILMVNEEQPGGKPYIGVPGGRLDEGEDVLEAAKRELREETGYEAEELILWSAEQPTTKIDWAIYTFVAKGLKKTAESSLDSGEKISLKPVSFGDFLQISSTPDFSDVQILRHLLEAAMNSNKMADLKLLFSPE
jgi:ADP-ribose pyrophosphatase YjhB (NUDIX family)